jgi:hypothetical protein
MKVATFRHGTGDAVAVGGMAVGGGCVGTGVAAGPGVAVGTAVGDLVGTGVAVTTITQGVAVGAFGAQAAAVMTNATRSKAIPMYRSCRYMAFHLLIIFDSSKTRYLTTTVTSKVFAGGTFCSNGRW